MSIKLTKKSTFAAVHSEKAKAELKASIAKEQTTATTATVPAGKAKALETAVAKAELANAKWERPNVLALCRKMAGGDMAAGYLLHHILYVWGNRKKKIKRGSHEWLAHSREAWQRAAGLTESEIKNRALPRLKQYCGEFLTIRAMGHGAEKKLYIRVDEIAFREAVSDSIPWEMYEAALAGIGIGNKKPPSDAYKLV